MIMPPRLLGPVAALTVALLATACGSSDRATAPLYERKIGVLQLMRATPFAERAGATEADTGSGTLRWSIPPGEHVYVAPQALEIPDTVAVGTPVRAVVTTVGLNGCWREAGMEVQQTASLVELTPMDSVSGAAACTEILSYLSRSVELTFTAAGSVTIKVSGRLVGGAAGDGSPVTVERTIVVR